MEKYLVWRRESSATREIYCRETGYYDALEERSPPCHEAQNLRFRDSERVRQGRMKMDSDKLRPRSKAVCPLGEPE